MTGWRSPHRMSSDSRFPTGSRLSVNLGRRPRPFDGAACAMCIPVLTPRTDVACAMLAANKPMIVHQIEALKEAGCDEVVLAINYRPQVMMDFLKGWEEKLGIKITCSQEEEPMGTAGPLALAKDILNKDGKGAPFFVLNSDVICEYPLKEMMELVRGR